MRNLDVFLGAPSFDPGLPREALEADALIDHARTFNDPITLVQRIAREPVESAERSTFLHRIAERLIDAI